MASVQPFKKKTTFRTQHSFLQALYIWSYKHNTIKVELEHNFFKAAQYILTSYSDKCNRSIQLRTPSERTLWVDRIASIFQTLGDQPGLIGFEWCETLSKSCVDDSINVDLWIKTSRRYLDGLRFDKRHDEILSMEASSGLEKEAFINGIGRKYLDASFSTFKKLQREKIEASLGIVLLMLNIY
ncbi:hypothetical protein RO3G_10910 [Rhizopus delemar RA 99-880]|uniref:Uncharacterized protein n=1 Tax=Rhizopus delemar (strain RA 99-880 / ATCC MYA-4621 / FGSC 9543 / NRRL 43880) TaxID=246409 RepID=I1CCL9_RHIO9|nr:hypothetical protein RO3G_10910 [Rhizopus delemar RA 99-880]|eukprot:EIE86199.1 hypothetical protein RO3G_10910 [Rhizopus delemar RA 99-880]